MALYSIAATVASILVVGTIFINIYDFNPEADKEFDRTEESLLLEKSPDASEAAAVEEEVLDDIKRYMKTLPAYDPQFFRVAEPAEPKFPASDLYSLVPLNQKRVYNMTEVLARLFDNSEHMEFKPEYDSRDETRHACLAAIGDKVKQKTNVAVRVVEPPPGTIERFTYKEKRWKDLREEGM